ncbi:MAG: hypothetical protein ACOYNY_20405 [Caldilineaceae bacterium]|jgi:hypothetical protein
MGYLLAFAVMAGLAAALAIWLPESRIVVSAWLIALSVNSLERQFKWAATQSLR